MTQQQLTQIAHSSTFSDLVALVSLGLLALSGYLNPGEIDEPAWLAGSWGLASALFIAIAIAVILRFTNKTFNILRSDTALTSGLTLALLSALPPVATTVYPGIILALTMTGGSALLFSTFGHPRGGRRRVYLLFTCVSALGMLSSSFLYYLPLMLVGCVQMRIFSLKTLLAAILGVITPPWLVVGSGLVSINDIKFPHLEMPALEAGDPFTLTLMAVTGTIILMGIMFLGANLIKVYSYNSQTRAMNGFYSILLLGSVLMTIIDFNNLILYVPLIMTMTAYQASHFFGTHRFPLSWVGITLLVVACWSANIWYTWFIPQ